MNPEQPEPTVARLHDVYRRERRKSWLDAHRRRKLVIFAVVLGVSVATSVVLLSLT